LEILCLLYVSNLMTHNLYCCLCNMKYISNPKQQSCESVRPLRRWLRKEMWNPMWWSRNSCDGRLIAKILITIQVNLCCFLHVSLGLGTKFTLIAVIKKFAISLPSQPFFGCHLGFFTFFHNSLLGDWTLFHSLAVLDLHTVKLAY